MHAVPTMMAQVAEKAGVTFRYGDAVETVLRAPTGRVAGVQTTSGERIIADAVVCTLDLPTAYQQLLDDLRPPRAARRGQYSPSAVVWHVGVRGQPAPPIAHHNIHFAEDWGASFDALQQGRLMPDPSRLVTLPSLDDSTMAPTGCSTLYVVEHHRGRGDGQRGGDPCHAARSWPGRPAADHGKRSDYRLLRSARLPSRALVGTSASAGNPADPPPETLGGRPRVCRTPL
jgi:phytoene dehydrogenase-like protein